MSQQPNEKPCCSSKRENNPQQTNAQNAIPRRSTRDESQNVNFSNTTGIYRINPYGSNLNSANCCPVHSTPRPSSNFQNQNDFSTILSQDFTITQSPQGGYIMPNVSRNTNMSTPYMYPPQMQGGPPRQQPGCYSPPQGYTAPRSSPQNMSNTGGYYNPSQRSQQQCSPRQFPDPNASRKQQVSFVPPSNEIKCPHRVYIQHPSDDSVVQFETPRASQSRRASQQSRHASSSPPASGGQEDGATEVQEATVPEETVQEESVQDERQSRTSRSSKPADCSPMNPCCSPDDMYQFELPRAKPTPEISPCPPTSICNKHPSTMGSSCPPESPCYIKKDLSFSQPRSSNSPCGKYGSTFVPYKPGAPACCQLGYPTGSLPKSGEVPRTPCLPTSPCARNYSITNKSPLEEEMPKCCQNAYNFANLSSSTLKSSCGQTHNYDSGTCGASCLSAQSCMSDKSKNGRSRIPQRTSSSGSAGKFRRRLTGKPNREDTKIDSINMLSVVISTVMFLAAEIPEVPDNYKKWSKTYLNCIKNLQGQSPPNIKKILKILSEGDEETDGSDKCKCPYTSTKPEEPKSETAVVEATEPAA